MPGRSRATATTTSASTHTGTSSPSAALGFRYDTTLGFSDALGFRAGIAHPFRPWDFEKEGPASIVEVPLAVMDATLAEARYQGLSAQAAKPQLIALLDWAAEHGGGFSILWHPDRFDAPSARGWDRLYFEVLDEVKRARRRLHVRSAS